jgi:ABC-type amino acid transport substrate-binding protein
MRIRIVEVGDTGSPVAFAFPKSGSVWLGRVDRAIRALTSTGRLEAILAKWPR